MIQLIHVSKHYDRRPALTDVTLEIEKGEFVLLMGPSGAGKSTLLRLLIGAERPDEGQVFVYGRNVTALKRSDIPYLRRKVGTVFQDFRLLPNKSVFENVALPLVVQGVSPADIKRKVTEALRAVGVEHKRDQLPLGLSTGEQQRVCIARAIVNGPVVLLADEPTGNLDPDHAEQLLQLLRTQVKRDQAAGILVTHSAAAAATTDRVFELTRSGLIERR